MRVPGKHCKTLKLDCGLSQQQTAWGVCNFTKSTTAPIWVCETISHSNQRPKKFSEKIRFSLGNYCKTVKTWLWAFSATDNLRNVKLHHIDYIPNMSLWDDFSQNGRPKVSSEKMRFSLGAGPGKHCKTLKTYLSNRQPKECKTSPHRLRPQYESMRRFQSKKFFVKKYSFSLGKCHLACAICFRKYSFNKLLSDLGNHSSRRADINKDMLRPNTHEAYSCRQLLTTYSFISDFKWRCSQTA